MINFKSIFYSFAFVAVVAAIAYFARSCDRETVQQLPAGVAKQARAQKAKALNADSLNSATEAKVRAAVDSTLKAANARQVREREEFSRLRAADQRAEQDYQAGAAPCGEVIRAKNATIKKGESLIARCDSMCGQDSVKMASFGREIEGKNVAIKQLSGTVDQVVAEIERRDNLKPKRFAVGFQVGYGVTNSGLSPYAGFGLSYNLKAF